MALLPSAWQEDSNDSTAISYAGRQFYVNAENPWSFDSKDNSTLRFEVRKGDQYVSSGYTDSAGVERAEMGDVARYSINQDISVEYKFMIEPGAKNTAKWMVMGQLHSAMNMSPPIEIKFNGNDKMKISGNSGSTGNPVYRDIYSDSQDIVRGHWYTMKMNIKFDPYGNGSAEIWRDGVKIVDYNGALGYTNQTQTYWKEGVYRSTAPETTAVNYKDLVIKTGAGAFDSPTPAPSPAPTPTPTPEPTPTPTPTPDPAPAGSTIKGTTWNDVLNGTTSGETIYGYAGNDKLNGKGGNDVLVGGDGKDAFVFTTKASTTTNRDKVVDFNSSDDWFELDNAVFTKLANGVLSSANFRAGDKALDSNDYIVYNSNTGILSYDADGSGSGAAVQVAVLENKAKLSAGDFWIL
jgi:Ca2+-binding RTX toxin-like protein